MNLYKKVKTSNPGLAHFFLLNNQELIILCNLALGSDISTECTMLSYLNFELELYLLFLYILLLQNCFPPLLVKSTNRGGGKG